MHVLHDAMRGIRHGMEHMIKAGSKCSGSPGNVLPTYLLKLKAQSGSAEV